jgi:hypothetical protein
VKKIPIKWLAAGCWLLAAGCNIFIGANTPHRQLYQPALFDAQAANRLVNAQLESCCHG